MNSISNDNPITTSGITIGAMMAPTKSDFPRNLLNRVMIIAVMVPKMTETVADNIATFKLVAVAFSMIGLDISVLYHFRENPVQALTKRDSLKE
jgi:hypothetical protein